MTHIWVNIYSCHSTFLPVVRHWHVKIRLFGHVVKVSWKFAKIKLKSFWYCNPTVSVKRGFARSQWWYWSKKASLITFKELFNSFSSVRIYVTLTLEQKNSNLVFISEPLEQICCALLTDRSKLHCLQFSYHRLCAELPRLQQAEEACIIV